MVICICRLSLVRGPNGFTPCKLPDRAFALCNAPFLSFIASLSFSANGSPAPTFLAILPHFLAPSPPPPYHVPSLGLSAAAHRLRFALQHRVDALEAHFSQTVIAATWADMERRVATCDSAEAVFRTVAKAARVLRFRCLLSERAGPVMQRVRALLSIAIAFAMAPHAPDEVIVKWHARVEELIAALVGMLAALLARGYQPHLQALCARLDFEGKVALAV